MPALDNLLVERHVMQPDGGVELDVRVLGPLPEGAVELLVALGGVPAGDDVVVARSWGRALCPPDPRSAMRQMLTTELTAWAAAYAGPLAVSDPAETL